MSRSAVQARRRQLNASADYSAPAPKVLIPIASTYVFLFLGRGVLSPFTPLWLETRGLSGVGLAVALAAPSLARLALTPALVAALDRMRLQRSGIAALALVCAGSLALMAIASSPLLLGACWFVAASTSVAAQPLTDVLALEAAKGRIWTYGRMRALGSAAYAVANLAGGALVRIAGPFAAVAWSLGASLGSAAAAITLPPTRSPPLGSSGRAVLTAAFWRVAAPLGLIQGSHAFFYGYATLTWRDRGLDGFSIGLLWFVAVVSEIIFLSLAETARRHLNDWSLMRLGALAGVVRWLITACLPGLGWQIAAQALHGLSFSAAFVASLHLLEQITPPHQVRKAQSVCAGFAGGLCVGLLTLLCGVLRERIGAGGFLVMAGVAALALPALAGRGSAHRGAVGRDRAAPVDPLES